MADMMMFPNTVEEFMEQYKITDTMQIYTNGADLVPIFRMRQWFEHAADVQPVRHGRWIKADSNPLDGNFFCSDCQHGIDIGDGEETPIDRGFYYCFNCGCAMDGGET